MKKIFTALTVLCLLGNTQAFAQWEKTTDPSVFNTSNALLSNKGKLYVAANSGVFVSTDNAQTWTNTNSKDVNPDLAPTLLAATANSIYAAGISGGSFKNLFPMKYNGQAWIVDSAGFTEGEVGALYADDTRVFVATVINTRISLFTKLDTENSWTAVTSIPVPNIIRTVTKFNNTYYAITSLNNVWTSADGVNFTQTTATLPSDARNSYSTATAMYVGAYHGLYKSTDGSTFTRIDAGFATHVGLVNINALFADGNDVYAASFYKDSAFKSTDGGATWQSMSDGNLTSYISSFVKHNNAIFATQREFGNDKSPVIRYGTASTGLTDLFAANNRNPQLTLYPNPASSMVHISARPDAQINLYSLSGALVLKTTGPVLDVSQLPKGIYFLQATTPDGTATQKLIVE